MPPPRAFPPTATLASIFAVDLRPWVEPAEGAPRVTLSPDMLVMRASSADFTIFLRNPPRSSFLFFPRTLS